MATREEGEEGDELDAFHGSRWICRSLRRGEVEEKGGKERSTESSSELRER